MEEAVRLRPDGRGDPRGAMADRRHPEARGEIDIEVVVDVADVGAPRLLPEDRGVTARDRIDPGRLERGERGRQLAGARTGGGGDDRGEEVAEAHISRRPASERPSVTSSVYSMSPPTGMPKARRVTRNPPPLSSLSGERGVASPSTFGLVARITSSMPSRRSRRPGMARRSGPIPRCGERAPRRTW